jgi:hypothetical protein
MNFNEKLINRIAQADYPGPQGYCWSIRNVIETVYVPKYGPSPLAVFEQVFNSFKRNLINDIEALCRAGMNRDKWEALKVFVRRVNCLVIWMLEKGYTIWTSNLTAPLKRLVELINRDPFYLRFLCARHRPIIQEMPSPLSLGYQNKEIRLIDLNDIIPFEPVFTPSPGITPSPLPMPTSPPIGCPKPTMPVISPLVDDILDLIPGLTPDQREALRIVLEVEIAAAAAAGAVLGVWEIMALATALIAAIIETGVSVGAGVINAIIAAITAWVNSVCSEEEKDPATLQKET